jgi:hypothetical protein
MTNQHTITPPPELVQQWKHEWNTLGARHPDATDTASYVATRAAQWGADQELEACLRLVEIDAGEDAYNFARYIRAARRPKPPSLKKQALELVDRIEKAESIWAMSELETIRQALEALPE